MKYCLIRYLEGDFCGQFEEVPKRWVKGDKALYPPNVEQLEQHRWAKLRMDGEEVGDDWIEVPCKIIKEKGEQCGRLSDDCQHRTGNIITTSKLYN